MSKSRNFARLARLPIYPWLIASYPALQLLAQNVTQVGIQDVIRSLVVSWFFTTIVFLTLLWLLKDRHRAALLASLALILFFSYGHVYELLRTAPILGFNLGRHRYLAVGYGLMFLVAGWLILRTPQDLSPTVTVINAIGIALLVIPILRIGDHELSKARAADTIPEQTEAVVAIGGELPDIYYIILDGYTRGDALLEDLKFDNSGFIAELELLGFYVAECARSNYARTEFSLTSAFNLEYMNTIQESLLEQGLNPDDTRPLVRHSLVRNELEELGYQTVAFQTGYDWSNWRDADIYLSAELHPLNIGRYNAFEVLLLETTALRLWLDTRYALALADDHDVGIRYGGHIELQQNILDQLPGIASIPEPTFTFAHLLVPHHPYIFGPNGEIRSDPGFFSGEDSTPIDDRYQRIGYTGGVEYVNDRMLEIVEELIEESESLPVIIIQGDHGLRDDNRFEVLAAYHLPGIEDPPLYRDISLVNTFRLLFDRYFGTSFGLLPDRSYNEDGDISIQVLETSPICIGET